MPEFASPEGASLPVECYGDTYVPAIRSIVRHTTGDNDKLRCALCIAAIRFCCPAGVDGDAGKVANVGDVPLPVPMGDPREVPGTMTQELEVKKEIKEIPNGFAPNHLP